MVGLKQSAGVHCRSDRVTPTSSRGGSGEAAVIPRSSMEDTRQTTTAAAAVVEMSEDDLRRKTKSIVDEYLHLNDLKV